MTLYVLMGLSLAMLVLAASPGPGVFATVARAMTSGFRAALGVIAGIVCGDILFLLLAIFGMSVVARTMGDFFTIVKICGGIYLIVLGIKSWTAQPVNASPRLSDNGPHGIRGFAAGLLITLSNPKVILFYCGFLPTFMDLAVLSTAEVLVVVLMISVILATVLAVYAFLAAQASRAFHRPAAIRRLHRTAGGMMVAVGVSMLASMRR